MGAAPRFKFRYAVEAWVIQTRPRSQRSNPAAWRDTNHERAVELEAFDLVETLAAEPQHAAYDFRVLLDLRGRA